jgi:hypothetical protein
MVYVQSLDILQLHSTKRVSTKRSFDAVHDTLSQTRRAAVPTAVPKRPALTLLRMHNITVADVFGPSKNFMARLNLQWHSLPTSRHVNSIERLEPVTRCEDTFALVSLPHIQHEPLTLTTTAMYNCRLR